MTAAEGYRRVEDVVAESPRAQLLADAIRTLTTAARLQRPVLERDETASEAEGTPVFKPTGRFEPDDWAEFVAQALAGAAANVGGTETALAGRPGSWEAQYVRQLVNGTVGHGGEYLWEHRTEPLRVTLYIDEIMVDVGGWKLYDDAFFELSHRCDGIDEGTEEHEAACDAVADVEERLEEQRQADWSAYGEALKAAALAAVPRRCPGLTVPVEVIVDLDTFRTDQPEPYWPDLEWELTGVAIAAVPLPGDGRSPLDRLAGGAA